MRYDILELVIFHTFSIVVYGKTMIFKMPYPMTYTCYPFETWRGYC